MAEAAGIEIRHRGGQPSILRSQVEALEEARESPYKQVGPPAAIIPVPRSLRSDLGPVAWAPASCRAVENLARLAAFSTGPIEDNCRPWTSA